MIFRHREENMTDNYVTGSAIKRLREEKNMTQEELAEKIFVTGKAVSKWETGRGLPDISLLQPLASALGVSIIELLSGSVIRNRNKSANIARSEFYVCPVCGNVVHSAGEILASCCGITLPPLEAEEDDSAHRITVSLSDGEYFVSLDHPMTKEHFISFIAAVSDSGTYLVKLYPEQDAAARIPVAGTRKMYAFCNRHGLFGIHL